MATILCVSGRLKTLRLLGSVLQLAGYRVLTARDSATALGIAPGAFHLAILVDDGAKGTPLAQGLKQVNPDVPILLLTNNSHLRVENLDAIDACVHGSEIVDVMFHRIHDLLETLRTGAPDRSPFDQKRNQRIPTMEEWNGKIRALEHGQDG